MTSLHLPHHVEEQLIRERQDSDRELLTLTETARQLSHVREFDRELKRIDQYLELVFITLPQGWVGEPPGGVVWERWHVLRHNPGAPDSVMAITTEDGGYREPDSGVLRDLQQSDMHNDMLRDRASKRRARRAEEKERALDAQRQTDREEVAWRMKAVSNPGIRFGGSGWTAKASRRGA